MAKRVAHNSPQTRITRRRIICAQIVFPSKYQRYATRIRGVGCAQCSPAARTGFNASDALISELSDIRPERSLRQVGLKSRDRVLAVERHATCQRFATCRMGCLDGADNSSSISQSKAAALDPTSVVHISRHERPLLTEAADGRKPQSPSTMCPLSAVRPSIYHFRALPFGRSNAGTTMADDCANLVRIDDLTASLKVAAEPSAKGKFMPRKNQVI